MTLRGVEHALDKIALLPGALDQAPWPERDIVIFAVVLEAVAPDLFRGLLGGAPNRKTLAELLAIRSGEVEIEGLEANDILDLVDRVAGAAGR